MSFNGGGGNRISLDAESGRNFLQLKNWTKSYHLITTSESGSQISEQHSVEPSKMENIHTFVPNITVTGTMVQCNIFSLTKKWQRETCGEPCD